MLLFIDIPYEGDPIEHSIRDVQDLACIAQEFYSYSGSWFTRKISDLDLMKDVMQHLRTECFHIAFISDKEIRENQGKNCYKGFREDVVNITIGNYYNNDFTEWCYLEDE